MAILTEDDLFIYAPSLVPLIGSDALIGKLAYLQSIIESPIACNRAIELNIFDENITYTNSNPAHNTFFLAYTPVDLTYIPTIEIRLGADPVHSNYALLSSQYHGVLPPYNRAYPLGYYETLTVDDYTLFQNGELRIDKHTLIRDLRISYQAGLNFSLNTQEIKAFKSASGNLLQFVHTSGAYQGIQEIDVPFDEYRIKYSTGSGSEPYSIPPQLLSFFKKYSPQFHPLP